MKHKIWFLLIAQVLTIPVVMLIFKIVPEVKLASTLAGVLFVVVPAVGLIWSLRMKRPRPVWLWIGHLQFWLCFALPIFFMRILNWSTDFSELSFLGVPGPVLHQWSSKSYMIMLGLLLVEILLRMRK